MEIIEKFPLNVYDYSILNGSILLNDSIGKLYSKKLLELEDDNISIIVKFPFTGKLDFNKKELFSLKYNKKYITIAIKHDTDHDIEKLLNYFSISNIGIYNKITINNDVYYFLTFLK